ncbi:MAG: hypothetical protein ABH859_04840 [Pseudomonadota bacterium]
MKTIKLRVIIFEIIGFLAIIAMLWANEIFDIPYHLYGAQQTPINIRECLAESCMVLVMASFVFYESWVALKRIKYLEGFLKLCAYCKRIHIDDKWIPFEMYVMDHSKIQFTHSVCPECANKIG